MPTQPISFGLEYRPGRYGPEGGAKIINAIIEQTGEDAKAPWVVYSRPGLQPFSSLGSTGGFRGGIALDDVGYIVNGNTVNKVTSTGVVTGVGTFTGDDPVRMARNRKSPNAQIAIVSAGLRSIIENDTVTAISDEDLPNPVDVCSIGGYFVFAIPDGRFFWTAIDEGTDISALDFASAEANPDGLVGCIDRVQEVVLFGNRSTEFYSLTGSSFVFERVPQTTINIGCLSVDAIQSINGIVIFPASDGTVRMLSDYSPMRVSHHDVERDIRALSNKATMRADTFSLDGHQYYALSSASWTWVLDLTTQKWLRWESYGKSRWIAQGCVELDGQSVMGNFEDNNLYTLNADWDQDGTSYLVWKMISGTIGAFPNPVIIQDLYLDILTGVGINSANTFESDPTVTLRVSTDDGGSWSSEMRAPVGKMADMAREVRFPRLGRTGMDGMKLELSMAAPVNKALVRASIRYTPTRV